MITMRDIADRAGVSRVAVSYVLNEKGTAMGISAETRQRILRASEELGYRRNELARAIATGKNPVFVFLVPVWAVESEVTSRILAGVLAQTQESGYTTQIICLPDTDEREVIERCVAMRPLGVMSIYVRPGILDQLYAELGRYNIPLAVLDSSFPQSDRLRILSDDRTGCQQAMEHLFSLGHERIAYIGGRTDMGESVARGESYRDAMIEKGFAVPDEYVRYGNWDPETVAEITRQMFQASGATPTAVFCADDKTAMVVCRTLNYLGICVPEKVSVVGFANLEMAEYCYPPLTTVAQPFREMGRVAVTHLLTASQEKDSLQEQLLPTQLIVRRSTAAAFTDVS